MQTKAHYTEVAARAQYKVKYEWRNYLPFIGSWKEVENERMSKPSIFIATSTKDFEKVFINDIEYIPR